MEAISDDDFDAYDHDLLERNKDCMEEMLMNEMITTNDVSINDILSIDWKSLLNSIPNSEDKQATIQRRNSSENRSDGSKRCLEMLNRIGHSTMLAGQQLSDKIRNVLKQELGVNFVQQKDKFALSHHNRFDKILNEQKNSSLNSHTSLPAVESASQFQDVEISLDSPVL